MCIMYQTRYVLAHTLLVLEALPVMGAWEMGRILRVLQIRRKMMGGVIYRCIMLQTFDLSFALINLIENSLDTWCGLYRKLTS